MRMSYPAYIIAASLALLPACTAQIASRPVTDNTVTEGLVYQLPATKITITTTHELTQCTPRPETRIVGATATTSLVPDDRPESTFAIDTTALQTGSKTIPIAQFNLSENILTGVNYQAKDKSGEIIGQVAEIAAAVKGISLPNIGNKTSAVPINQLSVQQVYRAGATRPAEVCTPMALQALQDREILLNKITELRKARDKVYGEIVSGYLSVDPNARLHDTHIAELRKSYHSVVKRLADASLSDDERKKVSEIATALKGHLDNESKLFAERASAWDKTQEGVLAKANQQIMATQGEYDAVIVKLRADASASWVPTPGDDQTSPTLTYDPKELRKWITTDYEAQLSGILNEWSSKNTIKASTQCASSAVKAPGEKQKTALYYRVPKRCGITLELSGDDGAQPIYIGEYPLAQFGYLASLPVTNGMFEESDYAIGFDPATGRLNTFTFKSERASALEAVTSIKGAYNTIHVSDDEELAAEIEHQKKLTELAAEKNKALEAEKKQLELQKQIDDMKKAADTSSASNE